MAAYKCIIFDCDGVLVDSEVLAIRTFIEVARENDIDINLEKALKELKGHFFEECMRKVEKMTGKKLPQDFESRFRKRSFETFKNELLPVAGVDEVLQSLELPFCTASSGPQEKIRLNLATTGLLHFFQDRIFSCYDIGRWKPDPAIFLHAAQHMGFLPEDCLVIEDSLVGVSAARTGGFDVFGFAAKEEEALFRPECTAVFHEMDQLISMISDKR
ncbi:HAD family hydrolase [Pareuzebyella sediminis]|uniref:HAD family hydrolase n=1 Tax=Pareuzebyella sediminis TaxID=2607998 RepID=UPI0011EC30E3|nr:HAD-IA family hydrolase [Pareuzebyella sediminis]